MDMWIDGGRYLVKFGHEVVDDGARQASGEGAGDAGFGPGWLV